MEPLQQNTYVRIKVLETSNLADDRFQRPHEIDDYYHPDRYRFTTARVDDVSDPTTNTATCRELGRPTDNVFVDGFCPDFDGQYQAWIVETNVQDEYPKDEFVAVEPTA